VTVDGQLVHYQRVRGSVRVGVGLFLAALLAALVGCAGSDGGSQPAQTTPAIFETCVASGLEVWSPLSGVDVEAVVAGEGPVVVLANERENQVCGWVAFANRLVAEDFRVALFDYADPGAEGERQAVRDTLAVAAAAGSGPFGLVGASLGGRIVIEAAAEHPDGLTTIVALSPVREVDGYVDILPDARQVTTPALLINGQADSFTDGARQPHELSEAMHGIPNVLILIAGPAHGYDLVDPATRATADKIATFLHDQLAAQH
jgi:pimeloyl-ACP methyl ester carboxylesterase